MLDEWCAKVGRDPGDRAVRGVSTKAPAASAESLYAVGTGLFTVGLGGPDYDLGPLRDRSPGGTRPTAPSATAR